MAEIKNENNASSSLRGNQPIGDNLSFNATEAYKKLRTNLLFSLPEGDARCRVVGVTSAIRGDGKTTTSVNLASSLADTGMKVLLIDADMRLPGVSRMLRIAGAPGLSNVLTAPAREEIPLKKSGLRDSLYILSGGDIPANPSELLGSDQMKKLMSRLKENFDFIIMDLPPITVVSDALVTAPLCDGFLLVVRRGYTGSREVQSAIKHLKHCRANILGYVLNDMATQDSGYSKANRSGYYNGDYRTYGYSARSYAESSRRHGSEDVKEL